MIFLANPNNPTGTYLPVLGSEATSGGIAVGRPSRSRRRLCGICEKNDYAAGVELVSCCENVVMLRTFSKIHGLASLRLGWAYAPPAVIAALNRVRGPFNVNGAALAAGVGDRGQGSRGRGRGAQFALAAVGRREDGGARDRGHSQRRQFRAGAFSRGSLFGGGADAFLTARGFILRAVGAYGLPDCLRLTVGGEEANRGVVAALAEFMEEKVVERLGPPLAEPVFDELAIVGVGLIGSSIARAARRGNAADASSSPTTRSRSWSGPRRWAWDLVADDLGGAAAARICVILCAPVGANEAIGRAIAPALKPGAVVSDVGSVKSAVIDAIEPLLPDHARLVPAHPVAGTEQSGPDAGFATCSSTGGAFSRRPKGRTTEAVAKVTALWEALGSNVEVMAAAHHDLVLAITSHVPHLIAYNIVGTAADLEEVTRSEVMKFSAGGFRDFTRIAASDPTMWRDVFLHNKDAVLEMLGRFSEDLTALQRMIRRGDGDGLFALFTRTRAIRPGIVAAGQETAAPDFGRRVAETDEPVS